ncbi:hypothetical protein H0R92_11770 [Treponema sp. OMZ 840]|uniref:HMA2 domain-containing protein n=1 Tax=Treponema sp. OMZ 840 TaxID=244313 RepID=UPI003D90F24F
MVISSFFPGRIRLRHAVLKDAAVADALKSAVESHAAVKHVECNTHTGSALIEYTPEELPLQKFELLKNEILCLKRLCDFYDEKKKTQLLSAIKKLAEKLHE